MPEIPLELLPILTCLGIVDPANCKWRSLLPWELRYIRARHFCECRSPSREVEMAFTWLGSRKVFIGQCSLCRTIYWRDAVASER